ncbi:hypothetical protein DH2020_031256 [Rehmannia glutinosa]|uniref:Uncharacterized protein n=1 Tax=Rehmannia glutinosa TaxID=99300 RepID=A0ABR0VIE5_REHGL
MRKRERENPCAVCGHYHKYEEGEVCGVCGHRMAAVSDKSAASSVHVSAFPSEILPEFLYLGSYDNAARAELLKTLGISRILNVKYLFFFGIEKFFRLLIGSITEYCRNLCIGFTVPACQNLYKNSFTYHCLQENKELLFDDAIQFLEQCEKDRARVLVHCMSGKNRSPAIVMAYLMKSKRWELARSYQWVKERRPSVELNQVVYQQLQEYEQKIFGSIENSGITMPICSSSSLPSFSFGFSRPIDPPIPVPAFNNTGGTSIFSRAPFDIPPQEFTFGAGQTLKSTTDDSKFNANSNDITMGGS